MTLLKLLLAAFIFISTPSFGGGGSTVGNGGGFAELKLIYLFENLETYLSPCLKTNSCGLSNSEKQLAQEIIGKLSLQRAHGRIDFKHGIPGDFALPTNWGETIYFDSQALYKASGLAQDVSFLGQLLLEPLMILAGDEDSALAQKVFSNITENIKSVRLNNALLHLVEIGNKQFLSIEFPNESIDLTEDLLALIPCQKPSRVRIASLGVEQSFFTAQIFWGCQKRHDEGLLLIDEKAQLKLIQVQSQH